MAQIELSGEFLNSSSSTPIVRVKDVWDDNNTPLTDLLGQGGSTPGLGIKTIVNYYKASSSKPAVVAKTADPIAAGWSITAPALTTDANVRWWFMRITYTDDTVTQSDIVEIGKLNQEAQIDYDEVNRRVAAQIEASLTEANRRLAEAEERLDDLESEETGVLNRLTTVELRKTYSDDEIKSLAEVVVDGKGYITLAAFTKDVTKNILSTAGLSVDAVNAVVTASADYATKSEVSTVGNRVSALENSASTYATKTYADGKVSDARTEWTAADKAAIISSVTSGNKVLVKDGVYTDYAYDPNTYASITAYETAMTKAGYTIKVLSSEMSTIKQESDKVSILVGEDGAVKAGVVVDAINQGAVTINANRINLEGYVTASTLEATSKAILNSVEAKKLKITTNSGMDISIDPENGFIMTGADGANLYIDIKEGSPTLYMRNSSGESFYLNPTVWLSLSGATSFTAVYVTSVNNSLDPTKDTIIYKGNDQKYYSATSSSSTIASGTYYGIELLPAIADANVFDGEIYRSTTGGYTPMSSSTLKHEFRILRWKKLVISNGIATETLNGYTSLLLWQNNGTGYIYLLPAIFKFNIDDEEGISMINGIVGTNNSVEIASSTVYRLDFSTMNSFDSVFNLSKIAATANGTSLGYSNTKTLAAGSTLSIVNGKLILYNPSDTSL